MQIFDQVPGDVTEAAAAGVFERRQGAVLVPLQFDSLIDEGRMPAFVEPGSRVLAFRIPQVSVVIWTVLTDHRRVMRGRVIAPFGYSVFLRSFGRPDVVLADPEESLFASDLLPRSLVSLMLVPEEASNSPVLLTDWVVL